MDVFFEEAFDLDAEAGRQMALDQDMLSVGDFAAPLKIAHVQVLADGVDSRMKAAAAATAAATVTAAATAGGGGGGRGRNPATACVPHQQASKWMSRMTTGTTTAAAVELSTRRSVAWRKRKRTASAHRRTGAPRNDENRRTKIARYFVATSSLGAFGCRGCVSRRSCTSSARLARPRETSASASTSGCHSS